MITGYYERAKREAKILKKAITNNNLSLSSCQELIAKLHGCSSWHELRSLLTSNKLDSITSFYRLGEETKKISENIYSDIETEATILEGMLKNKNVKTDHASNDIVAHFHGFKNWQHIKFMASE